MAARFKALFIAGGYRNRAGGALYLIPSFNTPTKKGVHTSAYDKNIDEAIVQPNFVPENVIEPQTEIYWGPHPRTGVFGPIDPNTDWSLTSGAQLTKDGPSVLDEQVRFRPLENIDKPDHV